MKNTMIIKNGFTSPRMDEAETLVAFHLLLSLCTRIVLGVKYISPCFGYSRSKGFFILGEKCN